MKTFFTNEKAEWRAKTILALKVVLGINILFPSTAFAYVDPGSGSVIVTTILGLIAAIGYTFRKYLYKLKRLFSKEKSPAEKNE